MPGRGPGRCWPPRRGGTQWPRELESTAVGYSSVIAGLTGQVWWGPSSMAMAAAAKPYVGWLSATGAAALQTAIKAYTAAAAYEAAFAMTVPPPVVAANRSLLLALIATNFLGQNTPAIAATEAQYMQMWVQDATAMYGYAADSATASTLTSFDEPPQTTNADGQDAQASSVAKAGAQRTLSQSIKSPVSDKPATTIGPGATDTAGQSGATFAVNEGTVTVGSGSTFTLQPGTAVTAGPGGAVLSYSDLNPIVLAAGQTFVPKFVSAPFGVTSGSVTVGPGSTVTVGPGGAVTGGLQSGATVTVFNGSLTPAVPAVTPTTATPTAAAPAATTTASTSTTSTTSSASTSSSTGTTAGTSTPAGQVPGAQPQSAPGAQPQSAPGVQPQTASGVPQVAPGLAPPHAAPGVAAPLAVPGGAVSTVGGPAAPLGDPLQFASLEHLPSPAAPDLALGEQLGSQPLVRTDQVVLTSGATLLGAGGGGLYVIRFH